MVVFVEHDPGSTTLGSAPVVTEEPLGGVPSVKSDNVVKGTAPEMIATTSTASTDVRPTGTSARSRPSTKATDEPKEVDCGVVGDSPSPLERRNGIFKRLHHQANG